MPSPKSWMQTHRHIFGDRPISELCIPESHDAGMSRLGSHTMFGTESNVLTQTKSIFDQLELGVRRLDIRPTLTTINQNTPEFACGHYTGEGADKIGWQGGDGVAIKEVIDDLNRFTKDNAELVIVDISHFYRIFIDTSKPTSSESKGCGPEHWNQLLDTLSRIENLFTVSQLAGRNNSLQNYPLDKFIGDNKAAVIVLVDGHPDNEKVFEHGFWPKSMSNGEKYLDLKESYVTRMQDTGAAIYSSLNIFSLFGPESNSMSVLSLSKQVQDETFPWLLQIMAGSGYAGSISMDRIQSLELFTFCLAISYQRFNISKGLNNMVIIYGGYLVTDQGVHKAVRECIGNGKRFTVTNDSLGCDPWPGMTKSCAVFYEQNGLIKGRFAKENQSLHFEQDIIAIMYGDKEVRNQDVYLRMLKSIANRDLFKVNNETLGGDPQVGVEKTCIVRFRDENDSDVREERAKEGKYLDFETFWEKLGKAAASGHQI